MTETKIPGSQTSFPEQAIIFYLRKVFSKVETSVKVNGIEVDAYVPEVDLCIEYDGLHWHENKYDEDLKKNKALQDKLFIRFRTKGLDSISDYDCINIPTLATPRGWNIAFKTLFYILEDKEVCKYFGDINITRDMADIEYAIHREEVENSLRTTHPLLAYEWHPIKNGTLTPDHVVAGSGREVWWLADCGHEWSSHIQARTVRNNGCPTCSGHRVLKGFNDLETLEPDVAESWHPTKNGELKPSEVTSNSSKLVWWSCFKGHEWGTTPASRVGGNTGCPYCSGKYVAEDNCLATCFPEIASQWHPTKNIDVTPSDIHHGSNFYAWWRCEKGHEWETVISNRTRLGSGCPTCAGRGVDEGENDLATTHPEIASQWHPTKNLNYQPTQFKATTKKRFWWMCPKCQHPDGYTAIIKDKVRRGQRCPHCEGGRFAPKYLDFVPNYY